MYILCDIGGTKTRVARSNDLSSFDTPIKFDTPKQFGAGIEAFANAVSSLIGDGNVQAIAGGIRGPLNHEKTGIISDTVLSDWVGKPVASVLSERFGVPVYLENDSAIVGLGEAVFGAGKGYDIVAYHTVSTGVGGARIVGGALDEASVGFEPGKQVLDIDESIFGHDTLHTLENLVSGTALERRRGVKPYEIPQDDPVWDELARYLAKGLKNTVVYWSPDVIVLGGSMIVGDPRILLRDIVRHTEREIGDQLPSPPIVDAAFRDDGGLYGAMALIKGKQQS